jgi:hypothetical protein
MLNFLKLHNIQKIEFIGLIVLKRAAPYHSVGAQLIKCQIYKYISVKYIRKSRGRSFVTPAIIVLPGVELNLSMVFPGSFQFA